MEKCNHQLPRGGHSSDTVLKTFGCWSRTIRAEDAWKAGGRRGQDEETKEAWDRCGEILATAGQTPWGTWPLSHESQVSWLEGHSLTLTPVTLEQHPAYVSTPYPTQPRKTDQHLGGASSVDTIVALSHPWSLNLHSFVKQIGVKAILCARE